MKKIILQSFILILFIARFCYSEGTDSHLLIQKLTEKGILTQKEAEEILTEIQREKEDKEDINRLIENEIQKHLNTDKKTNRIIENILESINIKGDLRIRYQWEDRPDGNDRNRARIRARLGIIAKPNDVFEVGLGIATGGGDPRSTNITLDETFESKEIRLDYAYAKYIGIKGLEIWAGKYKGIKDAIWIKSDLMWDADLRPEGIGITLSHKPEGSPITYFANAGLWILDEQSTSSDAIMGYIQPGIKLDISQDIHLQAACAYYAASSVKGKHFNYSAGTNTTSGGNLLYDYDVVAPGVELAFDNLSKLIPHLSVFSEFVINPDPDNNNQGCIIGVRFGDKKIKDFGDWQFTYSYRRLERDAWLDVFPDSDAMGGSTNIKGHELAFAFGLMKNLSLGLDYYHMEQIEGSEKKHLLQVDIIWKF